MVLQGILGQRSHGGGGWVALLDRKREAEAVSPVASDGMMAGGGIDWISPHNPHPLIPPEWELPSSRSILFAPLNYAQAEAAALSGGAIAVMLLVLHPVASFSCTRMEAGLRVTRCWLTHDSGQQGKGWQVTPLTEGLNNVIEVMSVNSY